MQGFFFVCFLSLEKNSKILVSIQGFAFFCCVCILFLVFTFSVFFLRVLIFKQFLPVIIYSQPKNKKKRFYLSLKKLIQQIFVSSVYNVKKKIMFYFQCFDLVNFLKSIFKRVYQANLFYYSLKLACKKRFNKKFGVILA